MKEKIDLPEDIEATYEEGDLKVEKDGKEVSRKMEHAMVEVDVKDGEVSFSSEEKNKQVKSIVGTFTAHLENMVQGLEEEHVYQLKGVYAHFPMDISIQDDELLIENFMGERNPRKVQLEENVEVSIDGEEIELRGPDKEAVGLTAGRIEEACKKGDRDPRTFQDGIYITEKGDSQ